jgi:YD repeat-containing protein
VTSYAYDAENRLVQVTDPDGDVTQLRYDANGNRTALILGNGVIATSTYDAANRLTSITYTAPSGQVLQSFTYGLDAVGNRLEKKFANGTADAYSYDAANRLSGVTLASGDSRPYSLDAEGNVLDYTDNYPSGSVNIFNTTNSFNQVTQHVVQSNIPQTIASVTATLTYDPNGNLTQESDTPSNAVTTYTYDLDDRMVAATQTGGAASFNGSYVYDANGFRVAKHDRVVVDPCRRSD